MIKDILIPDIGGLSEVAIIEISVEVGRVVRKDDPILMLESDKATLDIPSPFSGTITEVFVMEGDSVREDSLVMRIETEEEAGTENPVSNRSAQTQVISNESYLTESLSDNYRRSKHHSDVVVIGAGPGGYTAAFRAADLGRKVTLIDPRASLGGVCLNVGCIPSKALLHMAKVKAEAAEVAENGLKFSEPEIDLEALRCFKNSIVDRLTSGLSGLAKKRKIDVLNARAKFLSPHTLILDSDEVDEISFDQCIVAVGSEPLRLEYLPKDSRIMDSTDALELADIPERLLVIGGGIIGLEMAQVYSSLGSKIDVVELAPQLIPGADKDIVKPLVDKLSGAYKIRTSTKVIEVSAGDSLKVTLEGPNGRELLEYDRILVAIGRTPNGDKLNIEAAGLIADNRGFIDVDYQMRTSQRHIFAIGDVVGQPMLAHKAVHEGRVAAEAASGKRTTFEPACIPSVAYTDPEVAWVGLTETEAKNQGLSVKIGKFPWMASGRSLSIGRDEGLTKMIYEKSTGKLLGGAMVGPSAGELLAEVALAIEMGADAHDIGLTIHPHPTLSETVGQASEDFLGTLTDL